MNANTFLRRALIYGLIVSCLVVAVNYLVDPYGITGVPRIPGFNEHKVDINEHTKVLKKYQPSLASHNALVVGNSRVELGIIPSHACFRRDDMAVYNLGMPGADVQTQINYALKQVSQQPVETVFLSLDFTDFISTSKQPRPDESHTLEGSQNAISLSDSAGHNAAYYRTVLRDYFKSLFSLDALVASSRTLVLQSDVSADRDVTGFNPARDFEEAVRVEGPRALFEQKMASLTTKYSRPWYVRDAQGQLNVEFGALGRFLDSTAARGIKVYLFTNPFHESFWELMRSQGHMPAYNDWMSAIEALVRKQPQGSVELWDFSQDSAYIHEAIPAAGVRSGPLKWFWEPAHYRRELGDLMVNAMLSESCGTEIAFGRKVL